MARKKPVNRRRFLQTGGMLAAGAAAFSAQGVPTTVNALRIGFIGVANRGTKLLQRFLRVPRDVTVPVLCDVDKTILAKAAKVVKGPVDLETDFRKVVERKDLDAVVIATPDHWHALQTIAACQNQKDVYVEKPLSITVHEGRKMVEAVRKYNRVVQVGTHRRSATSYKQLARFVAENGIGKVTIARAYRLSNMFPKGMGKAKTTAPPKELDWNMWLGPRPFIPYRENIHPYKFRWWKRYSSQAANWGVHYFDAMRWITGDNAPVVISSLGGRFAVDDDRTVPDTMEVTVQTPSGCLFIFGQYEASSNAAMTGGEVEIRGTQGMAHAYYDKYIIIPERGGQFQSSAPRMKPLEKTFHDGDITECHIINFLDCIHSRKKPNADIETGHRSTTFSLLANISLETGAHVKWDPEKERIIEPESANRLLHYEYRAPWKLPD